MLFIVVEIFIFIPVRMYDMKYSKDGNIYIYFSIVLSFYSCSIR